MDCEKFESTLIDELYDELDELTSAAAKRHVAGCARCASLLSGLKATRRVAVLPIIEPPADLEDRILAAAKDAQKVVPMKRRVSNAVSWAGSWAMRPQTAMAAVFLLMIGSSALLLRGRAAKAPASAMVTVSAEGSPAPSASTATVARPPDLEMADNAHGTPPPPRAEAPAAAAAPISSALTALTPAATATNGFVPNNAPAPKAASEGFASKMSAPSDMGGGGYGSYGGSASGSLSRGNMPPGAADQALAENDMPASNAGRVAGAAAAPPAPAAPAAQGLAKDEKKGAGAGGSSDFQSGMAQYRAGNYAEATRYFDAAAASGDLVAELYAARSVENQASCSAASGRYDQLATKAFGTTAGYDATLAAGRCYRITGDYTRARSFLNRLLTVTTHARQAQAELDMLAPKAAAKPAARAAPLAPSTNAAPPSKANTQQAY